MQSTKGTGTLPALLLRGGWGVGQCPWGPPQPTPELKHRDTAEPKSSPRLPPTHRSIPPACEFAAVQGKLLRLHHSSTHGCQPQMGGGTCSNSPES